MYVGLSIVLYSLIVLLLLLSVMICSKRVLFFGLNYFLHLLYVDIVFVTHDL